jgi:hypothetical protein
VWPVVLLAGLPFAPESPYWLVRRGRREEARKALLKLTSAKNRPDIDKLLVGIEQTDLLEREYETETTYYDCFKGVSLVRTEISIMVYLIQVIGGNPLIGYANYFFEQAGLSSSEAFHSKTPRFPQHCSVCLVLTASCQWVLATQPSGLSAPSSPGRL